ncbi:helicase-associated domain-containing protein [Corynebacterium sp. ES2775-CONJ]|uniref:helicase-associated domain-containing protein n=1 Tax=Corynebacterium sp. ES2775-CONJ TaxID=2974029 RepID=UPI0021670928|nr:helicase-associated domain-containing protein [Corynebacterium sp. ES2775-CONJ]MCS4490065.1 helicase-associated domain-containing protein [Corynebacterium sp. ES2775-CONJ]
MNSATPTPPSLEEYLTSLDDDELSVLFSNRPDILFPTPPHIRSLAGRLRLKQSIVRALFQLNAREIAVLEALDTLGGDLHAVPEEDMKNLLSPYIEGSWSLSELIDTLSSYLLVIPTANGIALAESVADYLHPVVRVLAEKDSDDFATTALKVSALDHISLKILTALAAPQATGTTRDAHPHADQSKPIPRLIADGLLVRRDDTTVALPTYVRQILAGHRFIPLSSPNSHSQPKLDSQLAEQAVATALDIVRLCRHTVEYLDTTPVALLKNRGLGVRGEQQLTHILHTSQGIVNTVVALLFGARLVVTHHNEEGGLELANTERCAEFLESPLATQWEMIWLGWWRAGALQHWIAGTKDDKGQSIRLNSEETWDEKLPPLRRQFFKLFGDTGLTRAHISAELAFRHPYQQLAYDDQFIDELINEGLSMGALIHNDGFYFAAPALRSIDKNFAELLVALTPQEISYLIPNSDLTLLAPGPLESTVHRSINLYADLESPGLASVYRISESSLRRGFDAGRSAADIRNFFTTHLIGELPSVIEFLIDDISRTHGQIRGGVATSYLRIDDAVLLTQIIASPSIKRLSLSQIAPTVAVSSAPLAHVIAALRADGYHAVAEDHHGLSVDIRPQRERQETPPAPRSTPSLSEDSILKALQALKASPPSHSIGSGEASISVVHKAIRHKLDLILSYVDAAGIQHSQEMSPIAMTAGHISAIEKVTGELIRIPAHRLSAAQIIHSEGKTDD